MLGAKVRDLHTKGKLGEEGVFEVSILLNFQGEMGWAVPKENALYTFHSCQPESHRS